MRPPQNSALVLAAALVMNFVGPSTFNVLPLLATGAAQTLGFSNSQIGVMSFAISVCSGTSAFFAGMWVRSVRWPYAAAFGLAGMLVAYSLAMVMHSYWAFVLLQGAAGFFGSAVLCLALTILSDRADSARSFGIAFALQTAYQVAAFLAGPTLLRIAGLNGVLAMLAASSGLALLLAPLLPAHGRTVTVTHSPAALLKPAILIALIGCGTFFVNAGAYWTYIELMGEAHGITSRVVANCVALGVSAGILGGILAGILGDRFGKLWPLGFATLLTIAAALLLNGAFGVGAFMSSVLLYYFAWNYSVAYQLSIINAVDSTGRGVAISGAFGYLGASGGAALAALFVTPDDYSAILWLAPIAACLSMVLFVFSSAVQRRAAVPLQA